jgi:hypothetical protein
LWSRRGTRIFFTAKNDAGGGDIYSIGADVAGTDSHSGSLAEIHAL